VAGEAEEHVLERRLNRAEVTHPDPMLRQAFSRASGAAREQALQVTFEKCGVDLVELATEDDVMDALVRFATMRKHSLRRSA